jgi:acetyltransferase-like isoleucine patch superfamily enzyme
MGPPQRAARPVQQHVAIMAFLPLKSVDLPEETVSAYDAWLDGISAELDDPACDRYELCRRVLTDIYYPQYRDVDPSSLPDATRIALMQMDARNITLEAEYYADIDQAKYVRVKPLQWMWEMFDKSPLGENVHLGVKFRRLLAQHIFKRCGANFKAFHFVKFSYGYNLDVGDGVVVHRHVLLDDRGGIRIGNGSSVADYANIYSHTHALGDGRDIDLPAVIIEDGVRITYHATVLAGITLHSNSMLGALAVATKDIASGDVALGIPAQPKLKRPAKTPDAPAFPATADPLNE